MSPEEKKIATIGSDTMSSPLRAMEPILTRNVNGNVTLTFKIYSKYFDTDEGEYVENPFIKLLMVERVLKLKYKNKWYDLVIKNRQESSDQKTYSYTAKSLHINELSKSGYNLEFKAELQNNQGNVCELGRAIVEGTEWEIDEDGSELPKAYQDDQLYLCHATEDIEGIKMLNKNEDEGKKTIPADEYFYVFYNELAKQPNEEFQILYIPNCAKSDLEDYILKGNFFDSDGRIIEKDIRGNTIAENILLPAKTKVAQDRVSNYRGRRLVKQQKSKYNPVLERYVNVYDGGSVEGYTKTKFLTPDFVQNLIVNPKDFTSTSGWYADVGADDNSFASVELDFYPSITNEWTEDTKQSSRIKMTAEKVGQIIYNTAIKANFSKIEDFKPNDIYILRYKFVGEKNSLVDIEDGITFQFSKNNTKIEKITIGEATGKGEGYYEREISFSDTVTKEFLKETRFELKLNNTNTYYLSEMELFKKVEGKKRKQKEDGSEEIITETLYPGDVPVTEPITENFYYNVADNKDKISAEDYKYLPSNKSYTPVYNDTNYEKIASIDKSESNRFNLIQELCEVFECWANFVIDHDENGVITSKKIQFKEYTGETKWAGFKYGINLKSIQRTVDSEQIVTKTIVKANSNEHGENGYCSIDRAADNPIKQSYILNFDYYLNQGLLSREELNKDLYENFPFEGETEKGFYTLLQEKGERISKIQEERLATSSEYLKGMALLKTAQEIVEATTQELNELKAEYKQYSGLEYPTLPKNEDAFDNNGKIKDKKITEFFTKIKRLSQEQEMAEEDESKYQEYTQENYDKKIKEYEDSIANEKVAELNNLFFTKYRNFISEGSWSSEEYWDDNLYYMDALDVSRTSSKPKISYTINVIDVSPMEGYEGYEVDVGDKTFIEDPEFFGYTTFVGSGNLTYKQPYKEEIVITEIVEHLESPESNQIKVQNYKTQFDDLFQRITAQTQSLQYASGGYNRASAAFNDDGTLDGNILQNSILSYGLTLLNPENEGIVWDKNGIRIIDRRNTNRIIKLSEGKISLTSDGGQNWSTGISAEGISAELITTGTLNTNNILIGNSEDFSFRWDKIGLNAYYKEKNSSSYNYGKFVRFDKYGLYGYSKGEYFEPNGEQDVKENADFGLTWDGFFLKSKAREGWIEIDSENDFRVLIGTPNNYKEKIKIGEISEGIFGITIKDAAGNDAFYTDDNGDLTLIGHIEANSGSFKGRIEAGSGKIGNWEILDGMLTSVGAVNEYGDQGIYLDAINSEIYSAQYKESAGYDGWMINNDQAIFNNIILRGALKCAVLEYGEVQAVGGILMVRPSTTIKEFTFFKTAQDDEGNSIEFASRYPYYATGDEDDETEIERNDDFIEFEVENALYFNTNDWVKIASEAGSTDFLKEIEKSEVSLYSGINTNLLKCLGVFYKNKILRIPILDEEGNIVLDEEGNETFDEKEVRVPVVLLSLTDIPYQTDEEGNDQPDASGTSIFSLMSLPLKGMGLVNLGNPSTKENGVSNYDGAIGISLNSSTNDVMVPETSFSMFTLEERSSTINGDRTWKYLKPHIILGKIPNESIYDPEIRNKYGLYADAAEITGTIRAKTLYLGDSTASAVGADGKIISDYLDTSSIDSQLGQINDNIAVNSAAIEALQKDFDGAIENWFGKGSPIGEDLDSVKRPWKEADAGNSDTDEEHIGDLYYDEDTGYCYRFLYNSEAEPQYNWVQISDDAIAKVLADIKVLQENQKALNEAVGENKTTIEELNNNSVKIEQKYESKDGDTIKSQFILSKSGLLTAENAVISGKIIANEGHIGNWNIIGNVLYNNATSTAATAWLAPEGVEGNVNGNNEKKVLYVNGHFGVGVDGTLYASNAKISGNIAATSGTIGSHGTAGYRWQIGSQSIYNGTNSLSSTTVGTYIGVDGIRNYNSSSKYVNISNGVLTAQGADLTGKITATEGYIGDWQITNGYLMGGGGNLFIRPDYRENNDGHNDTGGIFCAGYNGGNYNLRMLRDGSIYSGYLGNGKYSFQINGATGEGKIGSLLMQKTYDILSDSEVFTLTGESNEFRLMPSGLRFGEDDQSTFFLTIGDPEVYLGWFLYMGTYFDSSSNEEKGFLYVDNFSSEYCEVEYIYGDYFCGSSTFLWGATFAKEYEENGKWKSKNSLAIDCGEDLDICNLQVLTENLVIGFKDSIDNPVVGGDGKIVLTKEVFTVSVQDTFFSINANGAIFNNSFSIADLIAFSARINDNLSSKSISVDGGLILGTKEKSMGFIELYGDTSTKTPYIDFHYNNNSTVDYTSRIIESSSGTLTISNNLVVSNKLTVNNNTTIKCPTRGQGLTIVRNDGDAQGLNRHMLLASTTDDSYGGLYFYNDTERVGNIRRGGSNLYVVSTENLKLENETGGYLQGNGTWYYGGKEIATVNSSDFRLKKNILLLEDMDSLFFDKLVPISFQYKDQEDNDYHIGFIAQDVAASYEEIYGSKRKLSCVYKGGLSIEGDHDTKDYYCIKYEEFIALNTNEIQKLKKRVAELEAKLADLLNQQN